MSTSVALPDWADPDNTVVTGELIGSIEPATWSRFIGTIATGTKVADAMKAVGIKRSELEGAMRVNSIAKEQYQAAKMDALRRNWTQDEIEDVMVSIMTGQHGGYLNKILEDLMLDQRSFYVLMTRDPEVRELYEEARQIQAENMADKMQMIADDGENDTYTDDKGRTRVDNDVVQRSRLRVDTMKWRVSKLHWKRFGDKVQQEQNVNLNVNHAEKLEQGRKRLEKLNATRGGS
jgi:hypothetical protein